MGNRATHRRRSRGGGTGDRSPLLGLGIIPPPHFLWCAGNNFCMLKVLMQYRKEVPKLAQNCIIFCAKLIFFFWGQAPTPQLGVHPTPSLFSIFIPPRLTWLRRHWGYDCVRQMHRLPSVAKFACKTVFYIICNVARSCTLYIKLIKRRLRQVRVNS